MGIFGPGGHPHHKKLSRHARQVIRQMNRRGITPQHADVLTSQVNALGHEVDRKDRGKHESLHLPPDSDRIAPGQRVRLTTEHRALLKRLAASRNLREQQALIRELRHAMQARIQQAARRAAARAKVMERTRRATSATGRAARNVGTWVRNSPAHARTAQGWAKARTQRDTPLMAPERAGSLLTPVRSRVTGRLGGRMRTVLEQDGPAAVSKREAVRPRSRAAR